MGSQRLVSCPQLSPGTAQVPQFHSDSAGSFAGGPLAEAFRQPGSLTADLHTGLLPLLSCFKTSKAAVNGLGGIMQIMAEQGHPLPGSVQEHLITLLQQQVLPCFHDDHTFLRLRLPELVKRAGRLCLEGKDVH